MFTTAPSVRVAGRQSARVRPPTWSSATSTPSPPVASSTAWVRSCSPVTTTVSAPASTSSSLLAALRVVAMMRPASRARAIRRPIRPMPEVAPVISTDCPARKPATARAPCSVSGPVGRAHASSWASSSGTGRTCRWSAATYWAKLPGAVPITRVPAAGMPSPAPEPSPTAVISPANSKPAWYSSPVPPAVGPAAASIEASACCAPARARTTTCPGPGAGTGSWPGVQSGPVPPNTAVIVVGMRGPLLVLRGLSGCGCPGRCTAPR